MSVQDQDTLQQVIGGGQPIQHDVSGVSGFIPAEPTVRLAALTSIRVANRALALLGEASIDSLTEADDRARAINLLYDGTRAMLLSMEDWRFTMAKSQLPRITDSPSNVWKYAYLLPTIKLVAPHAVYNSTQVGAPPMRSGWEVFGDFIYTNEETIVVDYTFTPIESLWPAWFAELMAMSLAGKIAMEVTDQPELAKLWTETAFGTPDKNLRGGYFHVCAQINASHNTAQRLETNDILIARFS